MQLLIDLILENKIEIMTSIALAIFSFYLLKFSFRQLTRIRNKPINTSDDDDDDDMLLRSDIDKRSLRPSYKRFMRQKLQQELNNNPSLCVICWNDRKTIVLLPCRHLCVCVSCSKKLWNVSQRETCPICRSEIDNLLEVFV